ncbi:hypothetical protein DSO57_1006079 [Entomophthora muscae]|uniref:Uncharacterized protein n=1 Tax=Entomophthora muscae TaxID=34485 RepID=A0ACC2SWL3_9FUNG|nr:hypothetical protein DSO57_1006079 [Entomophthora muscae]
MDVLFRQESNFFYLTGVDQPGYHLIIDINKEKSILFAPKMHSDEIMWVGEPDSLAEQQKIYDVDEIKYSDEIDNTITQLSPSTIHTINEVFDNQTIKKYESMINLRMPEKVSLLTDSLNLIELWTSVA